MGSVTGPLFTVGEVLVLAAFAFHAANGVRLVLVELGWAIGRPEEPIYPYRTSDNHQRPLAAALALVALLLAWGGADFFALH